MTSAGQARAGPPVLVVGTGGSGTSTVARQVAQCGVFMGASLIGADERNPYGLCEDAEFVALNQALIEGRIAVPAWRERMRRLIDSRRALNRPWGLKDPRIAELLPLYIDLFGRPRFIRCRRSLDAAARSLSRRFAEPIENMIAMVRRREEQLDRWLGGHTVLNIDFAAIADGTAEAAIRTFLAGAARSPEPVTSSKGDPLALLHRALERHQAGALEEAEALYRQVLSLQPTNADALSLLGALFLGRGNLDEAMSHSAEAVALRPDEATFVSRLGSVYLARGEPDKARQCFERCLALQPGRAEAHNNLGLLYKDTGDIEAAIRSFRAAVKAAPRQPEAYSNLGALLQEAYRLDEAEALLKQALKCAPDHVEAHINLSNTLRLSGRFAEAETHIRRAITLRPELPAAHNSLGMLLRLGGEATAAREAFEQALTLQPGYREAQANLNLLRQELGLQHADLDPVSGFDRDALAQNANAMVALLHDPEQTAEQVVNRIRAFGASIEAAIPPMPAVGGRPPGQRRLRVGLLSGDLRRNPAYYFTEPALADLDRQRFEVFAYPHIHRQDRYSRTLARLVDHWRDITMLDDDSAAALIHADELDLLIIASGYFEGGRMGIAARTPAPRQVNYPSFPATSGMRRVGWRLTDAWCDPPGYSEDHYTERLVRVDGGHLCYRAPEGAPSPAPAPFRTNCHVTFGSFNRLSKLNDRVLDTWSRILAAVPDARLYLKAGQFSDAAVRQGVIERFAALGIEAGRLDLEPYRDDVAAHLADYARVDIALDTFPYSGQTTTCEALWMGVPVVALTGDRYVARVSGGLLKRIGEPELVANDIDGYVVLAVELAGDAARMTALRRSLRTAITGCTLGDPRAFAPRFAAALESIVAAKPD